MLQRCLRLPGLAISSAATFLLAFPATSFATGNVLVVDSAGGGSYTTIQAAVDAAQQGDVLIVRQGNYAGFVVADKALTIVEDAGAHVVVSSGTHVRDLAAGRTVALIGLDLNGEFDTDVVRTTGLLLTDDAGHVRVEGCAIVGGTGPTGSAVTATTCADVALIGCSLRGGYNPGYCAGDGGNALTIEGLSSVAAYGCSFRGNDGAQGGCSCDGGMGGNAASVTQGSLFASKSSFQGGNGGNSQESSLFSPGYAGDAGNGIHALAGATVRLLEAATNPGIPGYATHGCGMYGFNGQQGFGRLGGTFVDVAGSGRGLSSSPLVLAGTLDSITVRGEPGDQVGLFLAPTTQASYVPAWHGTLLVPLRTAPAATHAVLVGTIPASGVLEFPLAIPALAPGASSQTTFLQAMFLDVQGQRWLSGAHAMTTLP